MLYELQNAYKNGIKLSKNELFKKIKSKYNWMKNSDSQGLCNTYQDLNTAYTNFFNKKAKFPKFKNEGLRILDNGTVRNAETEGTKVPSMPVENPTMDDQNISSLKSSDSTKHELLYKDHFH